MKFLALTPTFFFILPAASSPLQRSGKICDLFCAQGDICINYQGKSMCIKQVSCAGFTGRACPSPRNTTCIDDPRVNCDPNNHGYACSGLCIPMESG